MRVKPSVLELGCDPYLLCVFSFGLLTWTFGHRSMFPFFCVGRDHPVITFPAMALLYILAFCLASQAAGTCLPNGVAPERRKNLTKNGESFPVGVVLQPYRSAELANGIIDILISEVLGYNLQYDPHVPASSLEVIYAMIGCKTWYNRKSPGCEERKQELHFVVESWHLLYPTTWEILRQSYPAEIPLSADMGYVGGTGQFISASVVEAPPSWTRFFL